LGDLTTPTKQNGIIIEEIKKIERAAT